MKQSTDFLLHNWRVLITPGIVLAFVLFAGWLVQRVLFRRLQAWSAKTTTRFDDIVIGAVRGPFMVWVLILALHLATQSSDLPARATGLVSRALLVLWIVSLTVVAARLSGAMVRYYGSTVAGAQPVTTITQNLAGLAVVTIGLLILLNTLGISITPILTALGVGGLAVALALQDTLSNLFAGFYITVAGQVRAGDYIKLNTGEEGYVSDISWRSTTLRALANNLIVVPNAKLAQAIVTNYHLPEKRMSLLIPIGVSYACDPDLVEAVLIEEAIAGAGEIPGLLADPAPFVRFIPGFGDFSLNFTLICQVSEFVDQYLVQHELRKRIFRRFRNQGIEIPFPTRTIQMSGGNHQERPQETNGRQS
ncbi:MAG: mechanosensitive ion channel family protein [Candidatus Solibacter sp.]